MSHAPEEVPQGALKWNIKGRFRDYVRSLPDGSEQWLGGVGRLEPETIVFSLKQVSGDGLTPTVLRYSGAVRFQGYRGALRVDIADPWVETRDERTDITVNISSPGLEPHRIVLATAPTCSPSDNADSWKWEEVPTTLTEEGSALLGNVYPPGSAADPLTYWVARPMGVAHPREAAEI